MIQYKNIGSRYIFYEDCYYDIENPENNTYGFELQITWSTIPGFIKACEEGEVFTAVFGTWKREFEYKDGYLIQRYREPRQKEETVIKDYIPKEKMQQLFVLMCKVRAADREQLTLKNINKNAKIGATQLNNYAKKRSEEKKPEERKAIIPQEAVKSKKGFAEMLGLNKCLGIEKNTTPLYTVLTDDCLPY